MLALLQFYRYFLSPWLGNQCRFYPSCSAYSAEAYREHGFIKGCILTVVRIAKCNPWHPGGFDEVPKKEGLKKHTPCCNTTQHHTHN